MPFTFQETNRIYSKIFIKVIVLVMVENFMLILT